LCGIEIATGKDIAGRVVSFVEKKIIKRAEPVQKEGAKVEKNKGQCCYDARFVLVAMLFV